MIKILFISIFCAVIIIYLKQINSVLTMPAIIVSGIIIISYALNYLTYSFDYVRKIIEISGIENETIASILKITVIANLIDFTAITIEEFGLRSLSDKLIFCGKIIIFTISAPLIYSVFELIVGLLQ